MFLFTHEERKALPENGIGSVLYNTINAFPTRPVRTADGNYEYLLEVSDIINPVAQIENTHNLSKVNKLVGKQEFEYKFNESLSFTNRLSYNYASVDDKSFSPLAWYGAGKYANSAINADLDPVQVEIAEDVFLERGASVYEQRATYLDLNFESFFNYSKSFNDHNIKATLGTSVFSRRGDVLNGTAFNIPNNSIDFADISANMAQSGYLNNTGSYEFEERLLSNFLRAEYGFKYKYIFSAIVRRDGSSKFGPNSRFGYFPSVSGAWIVSDSIKLSISKFLTFLPLLITYFIGPLGLFIYWLIRIFFARRMSLYD